MEFFLYILQDLNILSSIKYKKKISFSRKFILQCPKNQNNSEFQWYKFILSRYFASISAK